jgi:site-specific DNA recombinase
MSSTSLIPYLRQSRKKEVTISIEEQRRDVTAWTASHGEKLASEVIERGVSGSKSWRERELGKAVEACQRGEASGIIVAWHDRLSRENGLATAEVWEALQAAGCRLVCVGDGIDTATGDHELIFTIKAAIARDQWKRHRANWQKARRNAIERGVHIGVAPAGYSTRTDGTLEPNEHAPVIRRAFELRAAGASWTQVAAHLTDAGVATSWDGRERNGKKIDGKAWGLRAAATLLQNDVYLGGVHSGEFVKEDAHEPIVSRALFASVQAKKETRASTLGERQPRLLAGLVYCASCGGRMTTDWLKRPDGRRYYFYRCRNVGKGRCPARPSCGAEKIEAALEEVLREWLSDERFSIKIAGRDDVTDLEQELKLAEAEQAALEEKVEAGEIAIADAIGLQKAIKARATKAKEALDAAEAAGLSASRLPSIEVYDELPVSDRRTVMAAWLEAKGFQLRVKPGRGENRYQLVPTNEAGYATLAELYGEAKAKALAALAA